MKILLTGGTGQLGTILKPRLALEGDLIAPPRSALDLASLSSIRSALDTIRPDLIVNAGAYTDVDGAENTEALAYTVNSDAPGAIGRWASDTGAAVIHLSTDYVFDGDGSHPLTEDDVPAPVNLYGRSKLAGEHALLATDAVAVVLRTAWVYGPSGANFLKRVIGWAQACERVQVVDDQTGSPTTTLWLAEVIAAVIGRLGSCGRTEAAALRGVYHAAGAGAVDRRRFAQAILDEARRSGRVLRCHEVTPARSTDFPTPARRPVFSALSSCRFADIWGFVPQPWSDGVRDAVAALKE